MEEVEGLLREARADRRETEREKKMAQAVKAMQAVIPGVHGRLADLGKIQQRRYQLAMAMAMNKDLDAVVTETEKSAKQCIQFLKDQRIPPLTFLPLDTIQVCRITIHTHT